jgi:hypothetical protein
MHSVPQGGIENSPTVAILTGSLTRRLEEIISQNTRAELKANS